MAIKSEACRIKAVLFDLDGTLTKPGALNFKKVKRDLGCPADTPVLEFIERIADPIMRESARSVLDRFEAEGAARSEPNFGAEDIVSHLRSQGLFTGIITRNSRASLERTLENFNNTDLSDFDVVITRDDCIKPKPSHEGILTAARRLNVEPGQALVVGDFIFDIQAGNRAGAVTVFLDNGNVNDAVAADAVAAESDHTISRLHDLKKIIRLETPLSAGKLPNDILEEFLGQFGFQDPSVLVAPAVGEDTTAVDVENEDVLVLKSDPITFATDAIGKYAVVVNANDIATSGATARWFLTTLLLPCGVTASEVRKIMAELHDACRLHGITLCGGHTEITDAVTRPVVSGMMAGTAVKSRLIDKRNMESGNRILMTKAIAVEGTAIIAREFEGHLKDLGISAREIESCKAFLEKISILPEAEIACEFGGVTAMHEVTDGGLATALE